MITKKKIVSSEIGFLNDNNCLYSSDFRIIGENTDYVIPVMRKYENLIPWILKDKFGIVNPNAKKLKYYKDNSLLIVKNNEDPRISVYKRLLKTSSVKKFKRMWVAIPHPDADQYCRIKKLKINYSYDDFLIRNNKFIQKEVLKDFTPEWKKIESKENLESLKNNNRNGYIKRKHGSGGYTVFKINKLDNEFDILYEKDPDSWFFEEEVSGRSCSIQCIKDEKGTVTVFGLSEQIIEQGRYYTGSRILNIDSIKENIYVQLKYGLKLLNKLLKGYVGFFGIDFIITKDEKVLILEANIRLTAVTIPTLLFNEVNGDEALFREDIKLADVSESDIITARGDKNTGDVLTLMPNTGALGKFQYIDLHECEKNPKCVDQYIAKSASDIISKSISKVITNSYYNFWPFGWTLTFILADSHCVITSWFLEKRISIDLFCCNIHYDEKKFMQLIAVFFKSKKFNSSAKIR